MVTAKAVALPGLLKDPKHPIKDRVLREAVAMHDGIIVLGDTAFFLEFTAQGAHELLVSHLELNGVLQSVGKEGKGATVGARGEVEKGEAVLARMEGLVNGVYPSGHPNRAAFFPSGAGDPSVAERLHSMAEGLTKKGVPRVPPGFSAAEIEALAVKVATSVTARDQQKKQKADTSSTRSHVEAATHEFHRRVGLYLRSYYGKTSPELAKFGLKVAKARKGSKKKRTPKEPTPPEGEAGKPAR